MYLADAAAAPLTSRRLLLPFKSKQIKQFAATHPAAISSSPDIQDAKEALSFEEEEGKSQ